MDMTQPMLDTIAKSILILKGQLKVMTGLKALTLLEKNAANN